MILIIHLVKTLVVDGIRVKYCNKKKKIMSELVNVTYENDNRRVYHVMTHAPRVQISVHFIRYIITIIFERERKKNLYYFTKIYAVFT